MQFGLSENIIEHINKVFEENSKVHEVILFGSRAKGNYRDDSDIDLALKGRNVSSKDILSLGVKLEALNIPYKIDLINYATVNDKDVVDHIDRVGIVFYERWKKLKLADLITFGNGKVRPKIKGDIPVYGGNGILEYANDSNYNGETIVIGRVGAYCGSIFYENKPIWVSDNALAAKPKNGYSAKFLYYFLKDLKLNEFAEGSSHPLVTQSLLNSIEVNITDDVTEQTWIASILSSLDDKIDLLQRQNKTLEQLAETLFRQWFVEEADESWEITSLDKHTEVFRGLSYKGSGLTEDGLGLPMHNLNSVYEGGGYKHEGIKFYNGDYKERHLVKAGDILVTNTEQGHEFRLIGFPAIVPDDLGTQGLFSQHIFKLVPLEQSYLSREFIYYLLMTTSVREQIIGATNGSTVNMLAIDGLQRPEFKLPPKERVIEFTSIVKDYWKKKNVNQNQIKTLTQLRDTLLPKLISGGVG
jgi:type I restriction enzyme S subunit